MQKEQSEDNKKNKLAYLLAQNKTKLARKQLIEWYAQNVGYHLDINQFIDIELSHHIKQEVYHKIKILQKQRMNKFVEFHDVLNFWEQDINLPMKFEEKPVIFYYLDTNYRKGTEAGGFKITFKDAWTVLRKIEGNPRSDIIVVDAHLVFGICIEVEEYEYLLTIWGF